METFHKHAHKCALAAGGVQTRVGPKLMGSHPTWSCGDWFEYAFITVSRIKPNADGDGIPKPGINGSPFDSPREVSSGRVGLSSEGGADFGSNGQLGEYRNKGQSPDVQKYGLSKILLCEFNW